VTNVRNKFYEDIETSLEEAFTRHRSNTSSDIPWWMWILLAWFASDNIMNWLASPIFFYPLIMIGCLCLVLQSMGILGLMLGLMKPFIKGSVNSFLDKTPFGFRI
jgi:hypothetical protein